MDVDTVLEELKKKYAEDPYKQVEKTVDDLIKEIPDEKKKEAKKLLDSIAENIPPEEINYGFSAKVLDVVSKGKRYYGAVVVAAIGAGELLATGFTDPGTSTTLLKLATFKLMLGFGWSLTKLFSNGYNSTIASLLASLPYSKFETLTKKYL